MNQNISKSAVRFFPLIDKDSTDGLFGLIETIRVGIKTGKDGDKFIFAPSEKEKEIRLKEQCIRSWNVGLIVVDRHIRRQGIL